MTLAEKLGLLMLSLGSLIGVVALAAAVAAGRARTWPFWLGGTLWGILVSGFALTDCAHLSGLSGAAYPIYFGGVLLLPVLMAWRQRYWFMRWAAAQVVLLLTAVPALVVGVGGALCTIP